MEQPTWNFSFQTFDWDAFEQRIYDRLVAKIKENPLLSGTQDELVLADGPSDVKIPDRFYPAEPISAMELYVRECILLKRENGESFIDVKELRDQWRSMCTGFQSGHQKRAIEINRNYLCLNPPSCWEPPFPSGGIVVKVPTLEEAMERVFFNKMLQAEPKNFRELPEFVAKALDLKKLWKGMFYEAREEYTAEAKELILRWKKAVTDSLKSGAPQVPSSQSLAPTTGYRLFKVDFCAQHDSVNEKDVEVAWQSLPLVKSQAYRDRASKLNDAYISLEPPSDLQQSQMPTLADFHWRIFATGKLSKVCIQSNMFCEWLEKTRRDWLQMPTGQICTALALQEKWLAIARKNAELKNPVRVVSKSKQMDGSAVIEQLTAEPTTAARLFEANYQQNHPNCTRIHLENAWVLLDQIDIRAYVAEAKRLNDEYVRLEPPANLNIADVPSVSTFQWRLFIDANHPPRGYISENDFCVWIEQLRQRWMKLSCTTYHVEAAVIRQKWMTVAEKSAATSTIPEPEDIEEALGPNVSKPSVAKIKKPKSAATARVDQATAERNFKLIQSKAMQLYTHHYRINVRKSKPDMKFWELVKEAEACWDKLSLTDRSPYIELAREAIAHRNKRDAYFKDKPLPK